MKRKSSDSLRGSQGATWASILGAGVAVTISLCSCLFLLMVPRQVRFINIRAPNLLELKKVSQESDHQLNDDSPLLLLAPSGVAFGSLSEVLAPFVPGGFEVISKDRWKNEIAQAVQKWILAKDHKKILPFKTILLAHDEFQMVGSSLELYRDLSNLFGEINKTHGFDNIPSFVLSNYAQIRTKIK